MLLSDHITARINVGHMAVLMFACMEQNQNSMDNPQIIFLIAQNVRIKPDLFL